MKPACHRERVLLTGIAGSSGRELLKFLAERPALLARFHFTALVRRAEQREWLNQYPCIEESIIGDLADEELLSRALAGVDTVLHIAHISLSPKVVHAGINQGVTRFILVHTTGVYSRYKSASANYIQIDQEVETMAANSDVTLTILRPTMIFGGLDDVNISKFIALVARMPFIPVVNGAFDELQPVHRADLGRAYLQVLTAPANSLGPGYDLSGERPVALREILATIADELDKTPRFISVPYPVAFAMAWILFLLSVGHLDLREKVQRLVEPRVYSHDPAMRDFGYRPAPFEDGLRHEVRQYRSKMAGD